MQTLRDRDLLDALRDWLVAAGVARVPRVAGAAPPLWLAPRDGVPAPGEGATTAEKADLVIGAFRTGGVVTERLQFPVWRNLGVDLRLRAKNPVLATDFDARLYPMLHEQRAFDMAGLDVIECMQFRELQLLGSDESGFDYITEYHFQVYA